MGLAWFGCGYHTYWFSALWLRCEYSALLDTVFPMIYLLISHVTSSTTPCDSVVDILHFLLKYSLWYTVGEEVSHYWFQYPYPVLLGSIIPYDKGGDILFSIILCDKGMDSQKYWPQYFLWFSCGYRTLLFSSILYDIGVNSLHYWL
jgi:hypothetical protein